jgi:predicted RNA-binding protein with PIN domain
VVVVDSANVIGSRPDGWWKDRAAATRRLHEALLVADVPGDEIVMVLEGGARGGARPGKDAHVRIVHAPKEGDVTILAEAQRAGQRGCTVTVVTADRALAANVSATGATVVGPTWLLDQLDKLEHG